MSFPLQYTCSFSDCLVIESSGVNPNIFVDDRGTEGAEGGGVHWGRGLGMKHGPLPRKFLILGLKMAICGAFLVHFFAV